MSVSQTLRMPFDDIRDLLSGMPAIPPATPSSGGGKHLGRLADRGRLADLGRLAGWADWVARVQGRQPGGKMRPSADRSLVCLFVATHGVALGDDPEAGIAAARAELDGFAGGVAPINAACAAGALGFKAFDLALDLPTGDVAHEPAMDERGCVATMAFGMEAIAGGAEILALGTAGPGGDLAACAMLTALYRDPPARWCAPDMAAAETRAVTEAVLRCGSRDPLGILADLGGRDIAAVAGAILAARHQRVPVVLDGFAASAAAAILLAMDATALDHCVAGHIGPHPAHPDLIGRLGIESVLPGLAIEAPGVGAALALGLVKSALACAAGTPVGKPG